MNPSVNQKTNQPTWRWIRIRQARRH